MWLVRPGYCLGVPDMKSRLCLIFPIAVVLAGIAACSDGSTTTTQPRSVEPTSVPTAVPTMAPIPTAAAVPTPPPPPTATAVPDACVDVGSRHQSVGGLFAGRSARQCGDDPFLQYAGHTAPALVEIWRTAVPEPASTLEAGINLSEEHATLFAGRSARQCGDDPFLQYAGHTAPALVEIPPEAPLPRLAETPPARRGELASPLS